MRVGAKGRQGVLLFAALIVSKLIGAVYRIPLINILGAEGLGMYQTVFPVFAFLITLTSGALPVALSKQASGHFSAGNVDGARRVLYSAKRFGGFLGLFGTVVLVLFAGLISSLQGQKDLAICYFIIAPSVAVVAQIAVIKGWYQGQLNMVPTALSGVIEQLTKLLFGLTLAYFLRNKGVLWSVCGAVSGVTLSELITLAVMSVKYRLSCKNSKGDNAVYASLISEIAPITASNVINPLLQLIDSFLIVNLLLRGGIIKEEATAFYGLYSGAVQTIVNLPVVLVLTLSVLIIPLISSLNSVGKLEELREKCDTVIKLTFFIGVPAAFLFYVFAESILRFIYPAISANQLAESVKMLQLGGIGVIFVAEFQILSSVLCALGRANVGTRNMMLCAAVKLTLSIILILKIGIVGAVAASLCSYFAATLFIKISVRRIMGNNRALAEKNLRIVVCGLVMSASCILLKRILPDGAAFSLLCAAVGLFIYLLCIKFISPFTPNELTALPIIGKIVGRRDKTSN